MHGGDLDSGFPLGAQVFIFFEGGDPNKPIYFAVAQSGNKIPPGTDEKGIDETGAGWFSEHPNQHVFKSDNVRIRIDEDVDNFRSTSKFDTYTEKQSTVAKKKLQDATGKFKKNESRGVIEK